MSGKNLLLSPYKLGEIELSNRVVMSPMARCRATNETHRPTELHVQYYEQRASAGLIVTESVWISKTAIGFINVPGIYSEEQVKSWMKVTNAVHELNGKIFVQLVHNGSVSHPDFLDGELPSGPSAINPDEKVFTNMGFRDTLVPRELSTADIDNIIQDYCLAAQNAHQAGFDGIEIHAQVYALFAQFFNEATNKRSDKYGGSIENRCRILFEVLHGLSAVYPSKKTGIKFSPSFFSAGKIRPNNDTIATFEYLMHKLNDYDLAYVHIVGSPIDLTGTPIEAYQINYFDHFRKLYHGILIANLGFTQESANEILNDAGADLVSFGTSFIANPDLVDRFKQGIALSRPDPETFYTGGAKGYTDYPRATILLKR